MSVGDKIKKLRKGKFTQKELAKKLGVTSTAVSAWELNSNKPLMDKIIIMADLFDVPITYFFDLDDMESEEVMLPVYGKIACGNGSVIFETTTEYEAAPKEWSSSGDTFYLRAEGDSMVGARIFEGDLLLIQHQHEVENGEIAAVVIGDEVVLKRVYRTNGNFTLVSENPKYPPRVFNPETDTNIRVIGKLKKMVVDF